MIKAFVLTAVFVAAVFIFGYSGNQSSVNLTTEMPQASYPVISMYYKEHLVGELHGYRDAMDVTTMRDSLVPVQGDREISVEIAAFGSPIEQVRYEIRSLNGERLIADRVCTDYEEQGDVLRMDLVLENLLETGKEYQLVFLLEEQDQTIRYYTRLLQTEEAHLNDYLDFVNDFHACTLGDGNATELSTYLEPDGSVSNDDLHLVTINSSLQEVTWGDMTCEQQGDAVLTIAELNDRYAVLTLDYVLNATGAGGELEYYNVREYYRVSYNEEGKRCYLHNFERSVDQIFRADGENFLDNFIRLGIRSDDVEYKKSENGQVICFVQEGELWSYNTENDALARVFSFRGYEGMDVRENYNAHEIRILSVNEGGGIDFAVCGYMNRGSHEGQVGVCVYHYDSVSGTVEEILFLRSDKSYSRLRTDMGDVLYENAEGILFYMMEGTIYRIDTADGSARVLVKGLGSESYSVSVDHHLLAWQEDTASGGDLTLMDLENEKISILEAGSERLRPIGFLEDDFVYGVSYADSRELSDGSVPMARVEIYNLSEQALVKSYEKEGCFITDVEIEDYVIRMERMRLSAGGYTAIEDDAILNHEGDEILDDTIARVYDGVKQTQIQLRLSENVSHNSSNVVTSKEVLLTQPRELVLAPELPWEGYYTYAKGSSQSFHSTLQDAIAEADDTMGVVVDDTLREVWSRAKSLVCMPLTLPEELDAEHMQQSYPDASAYDLTGCQLTQTLYYVSRGIPVEIIPEDGGRELLVGYDSANVWIYSPVTGQTVRRSIADAQEQYAAHRCRYVAYLR